MTKLSPADSTKNEAKPPKACHREPVFDNDPSRRVEKFQYSFRIVTASQIAFLASKSFQYFRSFDAFGQQCLCDLL
jgi:hypothetical protein